MGNLPESNKLLTVVGPSSSHGATDGPVPEPEKQWCSKCQVAVVRTPKGQCSVCGIWLKGNVGNPKNPVNMARRQQHLNELLAHYRPRTPVLKALCAQLANVLEREETTKPGSQEHQRLVQASQTLISTLDATRPPEAAPPQTLGECTTDEDFERLRGMARHERLGRHLARYHLLLDSMPPRAVLWHELDAFRRIFASDGDVEPDVIAALDHLRELLDTRSHKPTWETP